MTDISKGTQNNPFASPTSHPLRNTVEVPLSKYSIVRIGLQIIYYSIVTLTAVIALMFLSAMLFESARGDPAALKYRQVFFISIFISQLVMLVMIVGFCLVLGSPRSDEKSFAIASVVCFFLSIGGVVGNMFITRDGGEPGILLPIGSCLLITASAIEFCLLLKRIGRNISSSILEQSARSMLFWHGIAFHIWLSRCRACNVHHSENRRIKADE